MKRGSYIIHGSGGYDMARLNVGNGLEEYLSKLGNLAYKSMDMCKEAAKEGGKIVADAIRAEMDALPTDDKHGTELNPRKGPRVIEKIGLQHSFGVAPVRNDNGYINVKCGFDGYNVRGKANALVARSVVKGTSFMQRNNFVGRATRKSKKAAEDKMKLTVDETINSIMN